MPPPTTPPSTTPGSTTPPTTVPEFNQTTPRRFGPADVGRAYYASSDDVMYDPADGSYANQYVKQQRIEYAWFIMLPKVIALSIELGLDPLAPNTLQDDAGKFIFGYGCRYIQCEQPNQGGQYVWRANYLVDRWRNALDALADKLLKNRVLAIVTGDPWTAAGHTALATRPWLAPLMGIGVTATPRQAKVDKSRENEGELNGGRAFRPLNATQCRALANALFAHMNGTNIDGTQLAFEGTARDVYEQALFEHQFPTGIYPDKTPARIADLNAKKHAAYREWADSFGCAITCGPAGCTATPTQTAPSTAGVVRHRWKHVRNHLLRALPEGYVLRELCDAYIDNCPIDNE